MKKKWKQTPIKSTGPSLDHLIVCWRKNQHIGIRGQVFAESRKVNQACQSIWPEINKGENKVKFASLSAEIPNISQLGVSASFADTIDDKKDIKYKRVVKERIGKISRYTRRQNRLLDSRSCVYDKI